MTKTPLPHAPDPLSTRQNIIWYVAVIGSAIGCYFVMKEGGADFKEPFVMGVYFVSMGLITWLLRKFILSRFKDRT